ncbi:polymorphic toxin-type HINT domain-containing protein [Paenibacillus senegalimassiliensis]|uniref:polymorphic toxin-type HINT domain-containing protein n=1 Tax=Paenibacillus senegalimassiliensis TaxID=1737426 RepID=UPI001E3FAE61|nr:polymorphic toxin-type HINT domain-containing protein [Paenibacillus senegalimassiliensis]
MILDDINTLRDPNSSDLAKGLSIAGFIPVGKVIKVGKLVLTLANSTGKTVKKEFKLVDKALDFSKKCNCFTAGTKVLTDEGEKNIEDIQVEDMVLAKDEETGDQAYKEVTHLYRNDKEIIYELAVGDQIIETTDNHPFWVEGKGWVLAADLQVGDELQQNNGNTLTIDNINIVKHDEMVKVYNFTVADFHTYYVSSLGIWVHNINCGDKTPGGRIFTKHGAERADERGFTSETIDNIINNNKKNRVKEIGDDGKAQWRYQDSRGNTVITDEWGENVVTVYSYPQGKNHGNYIPKPKK